MKVLFMARFAADAILFIIAFRPYTSIGANRICLKDGVTLTYRITFSNILLEPFACVNILSLTYVSHCASKIYVLLMQGGLGE